MKKGLVSSEALAYLNMKKLSDRYGWTPGQIRDMTPEDLFSYLAMLDGESKKSGGNSTMPQMPHAQMRGFG